MNDPRSYMEDMTVRREPEPMDGVVVRRSAIRPDPDPFTGYVSPRTAKFAWSVIGLSVMAIAAFVLLYNAVHPHMVVPQ